MSKFFVALLLLWLGIAPALAQAPPPVPALPDSERRTTYTITGTTCACAVGFQIYGDGTDYQNWVEVWINGVMVNYNDPTFGWTITSPSGPLSSIARPITNAVLTFNNVQTGTVQIVGARRPRRTTQFPENRGVAARDFNQVLTDIVAEDRETWDKINDVTGRAIIGQPGTFMLPLPPAANCINKFINLGGNGATPSCLTQLPLLLGSITVTVRSSTGPTVTASPTTDYFLCLDPTSNAITVNLPATPSTGLTFLIKDCTGQSGAHNITIAPAAGNIDGAPTFVIGSSFQSTAITYTGVQWSLN